MIALRLGDVLWVEVAQALRGCRGDRHGSGSKQQECSTHELDPLSRFVSELSAGILNGE
jgi:hypothetical protein